MTAPGIGRHVLAVRLGARSEAPCSLAVVEVVDPPLGDEQRGTFVDVRYVERRGAGSVVEHCAYLARLATETPELARAELVVDVNGAPVPVLALVREALRRPPVELDVTRRRSGRDGRRVALPGRDLVSLVAVLLQSRRLRVVQALPGADALLAELQRYAAGRSSDDLAATVAAAVWQAENGTASSAFLAFLRQHTAEIR